MVPSLPLLSCESSVSVKENPDRKNKIIRALAKVLILTTEIFPAWNLKKCFNFLNRNILFPESAKMDQTYFLDILIFSILFRNFIVGCIYIEIILLLWDLITLCVVNHLWPLTYIYILYIYYIYIYI